MSIPRRKVHPVTLKGVTVRRRKKGEVQNRPISDLEVRREPPAGSQVPRPSDYVVDPPVGDAGRLDIRAYALLPSLYATQETPSVDSILEFLNPICIARNWYRSARQVNYASYEIILLPLGGYAPAPSVRVRTGIMLRFRPWAFDRVRSVIAQTSDIAELHRLALGLRSPHIACEFCYADIP